MSAPWPGGTGSGTSGEPTPHAASHGGKKDWLLQPPTHTVPGATAKQALCTCTASNPCRRGNGYSLTWMGGRGPPTSLCMASRRRVPCAKPDCMQIWPDAMLGLAILFTTRPRYDRPAHRTETRATHAHCVAADYNSILARCVLMVTLSPSATPNVFHHAATQSRTSGRIFPYTQ